MLEAASHVQSRGVLVKSAGLTYHDVARLCYDFNHATAPYKPRTEREHVRMNRLAKALRNRLLRLGAVESIHYFESENGSLHPLTSFPAARSIS
jgi:hypothetical protein